MIKQSLLSAAAAMLFSIPSFALTDQSKDIRAVLENGTLSKADCDRYYAGQTDEATTLRCGKFMFFYDTLGLPGLPKGIIDLLRKNAPNTVGMSFEKFGMFADPYSADQLPVGFVPGHEQKGGYRGYTPTCATCHFAKTPDGTYVVGQPNHNLDISKLFLTLAVVPEVIFTPKKTLPEPTESAMRPILNEFYDSGWNSVKVIGELIKILPNVIATGKKPPTEEQKAFLAVMPKGVMDAFAAPVYDDSVDLPQRILPLWGIEPDKMVEAGSTDGAMLGSTGGTRDLTQIFEGIARFSEFEGGQNFIKLHGIEYAKPLEQYILSLKAPKNPAALDQSKIERGAKLFEASCQSCHNGAGYMGTKVYSFEEIGTDPNLKYILDPDLTGKAAHDFFMPDELTQGVKAGRLTGLWSIGRFLHNGSLSSLDQMFCLNGPRPASKPQGFSTAGHSMTCDNFTREEKLELMEFIKSL